MKKKALTVILPLCVAMAMTACGGNADKAEVEETTVTEESTDADAPAEAEAEEKAQGEAEEQTQEETEEQARLKEANEYYEAGRKSLYGLDGAQIDMEDAYTNFTKAQELGNTDANFYLGVMADDYYFNTKRDFEQARAYYEQSGDNPYAQIALGCLYYYGKGVEKDTKKGKELFQSATDQGVVEGYYGLGLIANGEGDFDTALEYYNKVAEDGTEQLYIASATTILGNLYQYGIGVEQDSAKAIEWYTKAADLGNAIAMNSLGSMYDQGDGVEQDGAKAIEWYTKAADLGDTEAMHTLGFMYLLGNGVEQDGAKAIEWLTKAADLGNTNAMYDLGMIYQYGNGVEQDTAKATEWYTKVIECYTKAADSGDTNAMYLLGQMYQYGEGVEQDDAKAIEWYTKAADLGDSMAKIALEELQGQ